MVWKETQIIGEKSSGNECESVIRTTIALRFAGAEVLSRSLHVKVCIPLINQHDLISQDMLEDLPWNFVLSLFICRIILSIKKC